MVNLVIDGVKVEVAKGSTILQAAEKVGIKIPTLCYLQKISPTGACRVCAVEVAGADKTMTACNTPAEEGMSITTQSDKLRQIRRQIVQLLLVNHPLDCPVCDRAGECDLQDICYEIGADKQDFEAEDLAHDPITEWPLIEQIPSRCVMCEKCVKVCHEVVGASALDVEEFGDRAFINTNDGSKLDCEFCGNCVANCPTGTLNSKAFKFTIRGWELTKTASVCALCSSQCQVYLETKNNKLYRISSSDTETVNEGNLCIGASYGYDFINSEKRLKKAAIGKGSAGSDVTIDKALSEAASKLKAAGSNAAGLISSRMTNEELYLFQKMFNQGLASTNYDTDISSGMVSAYNTIKSNLGLSGASNPIDRIGKSDAVLMIGCEPTVDSPAIGWQIGKAHRKNDAELIVANIRSIKESKTAQSFLNYSAGSQAALITALTRIIVDLEQDDSSFANQFVDGYDDWKKAIQSADIDALIAATGVSKADIQAAATLLGKAESVSIVYGNDILDGTDTAAVTAMTGLAVVTGALHGDIGGLFPAIENGNMQGAFDMGAVALAEGQGAQDILEKIEKGSITSLYLVGVNPLIHYTNGARWQLALEKLDCLIVQDVLQSALTDMADIVLPGTTFAEKSGFMTAPDHRVSKVVAGLKPSGDACTDFDLIAGMFRKVSVLGNTNFPTIAREISETVEGYGTLAFSTTDKFPYAYARQFSPQKGITLANIEITIPAKEKMVAVICGDLHHFDNLTTESKYCREVSPVMQVTISADDAISCNVADGAKVKVTAGSNSVVGVARISASVPPGVVSLPYNFADTPARTLLTGASNQVAITLSAN